MHFPSFNFAYHFLLQLVREKPCRFHPPPQAENSNYTGKHQGGPAPRMDAFQTAVNTKTRAQVGRHQEETQNESQEKLQDSEDKVRAILGLLEGSWGPGSAASGSLSDDDGPDDDDDVDYMEDDGAFAVSEEEEEHPASWMGNWIPDSVARTVSTLYWASDDAEEAFPYECSDPPLNPWFRGGVSGAVVEGARRTTSSVESTWKSYDEYDLESLNLCMEFPVARYSRDERRYEEVLHRLDLAPSTSIGRLANSGGAPAAAVVGTAAATRVVEGDNQKGLQRGDPLAAGAAFGAHSVKKEHEETPQHQGIDNETENASGNEGIIRTSPTARDGRAVGAPEPAPLLVAQGFRRGRYRDPRRNPEGLLGRMRIGALNIARRVVEYLETRDQSGDNGLGGDLAHGERALVARGRDIPAHPSSPKAGPQVASFMVLPPGNLPPPQAKSARALRPRQPRPPGEFENLLRTKIFKPVVQLSTAFPEPHWGSKPVPGFTSLFPNPPGVSLACRTLTTLGQFVADRDRTIRETLKDVELGLGVNAGGVGVDFSTKGVFGLLKPVQWINTWRSLPREVHINSLLLESRLRRPNYAIAAPITPPSEEPDELEKEIEKALLADSAGPDTLMTDVSVNSDDADNLQHHLLHRIDHELMSSFKYQLGQSEYITVVTFSEASRGDRVNSGAISLFRASGFVPGRNGVQATKLDLEARFQDVPGAICRILVTEGDPNRFELRRNGKKLSVKSRGSAAPLRPGVVRIVGKSAKESEGGQDYKLEAASERGGGSEEWTSIGSGWRRALHILLDHADIDRGGEDDDEEEDHARDGLIATIPQMLALLHLRYRTVDCVPSSQVFSFSSPLECNKLGEGGPAGGTWFVRRGVKLFGPPIGASHVGSTGTVAVLFSRESRWAREQLFWA